MKIQRLLGILCILANTDKITAKELAQRFEVSKRTILRDLDALGCAGIPIVTYPGAGGGVSVMKGYKTGNTVLSTEDVENIFTALNGLKSIEGTCGVTNLIAKLAPEKESKLFSHSQYVIDFSSWSEDNPTKEKAAELAEAIRSCRCVCLEYVSKNGRLLRTVEPHKLIFRQSHWYLYGFCRKRNDFRLFKLRRIVGYKILEEPFEKRPINKIELKSSYGANLFSKTFQEGMFQVVLEYNASEEFALTDKIDASFLEKDAGPETEPRSICFFASDLSWTADFIIEIIDKVQVISPPELREQVKRRINKINSQFKR